jgi:transposase-like protein
MPNDPDPEVPEKATRRRFTAAYKARILAAYDAATEPGAKGALLRREGLYTSHIAAWRQAREQGGAPALDRKRGRKPADPRDVELARLRRVGVMRPAQQPDGEPLPVDGQGVVAHDSPTVGDAWMRVALGERENFIGVPVRAVVGQDPAAMSPGPAPLAHR